MTDAQYLNHSIKQLKRVIAYLSENGADQDALNIVNGLLEVRFNELDVTMRHTAKNIRKANAREKR